MAAPKTEQRAAGGVCYTLTRRRGRNINLRVRADGSPKTGLPPTPGGMQPPTPPCPPKPKHWRR